MTERSLQLSKPIDPQVIERLCLDADLTITMKGTLKSLPINIHWHYKRGKEKGTLEITLMLSKPEVIFSYKENRAGDWIDGVIEGLIAEILAQGEGLEGI